MKFTILLLIMCVGITSNAQTENTLLDQEFWKSKPSVALLKSEIEKGNDPTAFTSNGFDPVVMAINNEAPTESILYLLKQEGNSIDKITHDSRIYLHWASSRGNIELIDYLLKAGSDVQALDSHGSTPAAFAASGAQKEAKVYELLFNAGTDPKQKYRNGANLLLMAIPYDQDLVLTEYFMSKGLSINDVDDYGNTAFNYAARTGNVEFLKSLLQKNIPYSDNALLFAAQGTRGKSNTIEVYKYLIDELKLNPNAKNETSQNALHYLVRKPEQEEIIHYLISKGIQVDQKDDEGNSPFSVAASGKNLKILELLIPYIKNINDTNENGESPLSLAVKNSSAEIVNFLIDNGADLSIIDKAGNNLSYYLIDGYRPSMSARGNNEKDDFLEKLAVLKSKNSDFNQIQKDGNTLYHVAISKNDIRLLKKIEDLNLDINAKNNEGMTVLHKAALTAKDDEILKYLISKGADKSILTEFDESAYDLALENEILAEKKINIDFLK